MNFSIHGVNIKEEMYIYQEKVMVEYMYQLYSISRYVFI